MNPDLKGLSEAAQKELNKLQEAVRLIGELEKIEAEKITAHDLNVLAFRLHFPIKYLIENVLQKVKMQNLLCFGGG